MANNAIMVFDGTPTTVIATTGTIADGVFTVSGTNATHTEFDNSTDLWPLAVATLSVPDSWEAATPDSGATIDLYMIRQDVDSTSDVTAPTTSDKQGAEYVGSFQIYATDEAQYQQIVISLSGVRKAKFSFQNNTGQTMSYSSGATVKVEGFSYTPST